jgi:excinuclease ABC subunit C
MKDARGSVLYVGKAANLRRRVSSYFLRPHDTRIQKMVSEIRAVETRETDSALEALVLEAELIKKEFPPYNIREKDDKSFLFVEITKEKYPRVLIVRGKSTQGGERFGPFVSSSSLREAMRILRKIFPWNVHAPNEIGKMKRPCFDAQLGLCPGTCMQKIDLKEYRDTVRSLKLFLSGKKRLLIRRLEREMQSAANALEFERAGRLKRRIFALQHIQDSTLIGKDEPIFSGERGHRVEGYDISNISGSDAVGAMVVSHGGKPQKSEYKKFIIKTITGANDTGMLREVLSRRLANNWPLPDLFLIDGGKPQVNSAKEVLVNAGIAIPVVGIAKGADRKKNEFIGEIPTGISEIELILLRDEAHRFAISFHRERRGRPFRKHS